MSRSKILFGLSGSIACYKIAGLISKLVHSGHDVQCVGTEAVKNFVGPATLEGLTGRPFLSQVFQEGRMMDHIHLARWADIYVIAPATASTLAKLSNGLADDLVSALYLALEAHKPVLIAPAMNHHMWQHSATQKNISELKSRGIEFLGPESGSLACGEIGEGRLIEISELERVIESRLTPKGKKILITGGGTSERIDGVRKITNTSTGKTAATLADQLSRMGFSVDLLTSIQAASPSSPQVSVSRYDSFQDLKQLLREKLSGNFYSGILHAAAVSDYSVESIVIAGVKHSPSDEFKIESAKSVQLELKSNPKLLAELREWSQNKEVKIFGFKLTKGADPKSRDLAVKILFQNSAVNGVVHNDLSEIHKGHHPFNLYYDDAENPARRIPDAWNLANEIGASL